MDDYYNGPDFVSYEIRLITMDLKILYSFRVDPFSISPCIGVSYLQGGIKYPIPKDWSPPANYPYDLNISYKSNDLGYLASIRSSIRVFGNFLFDSEMGYRVFDLGMPRNADGDPWFNSKIDFSGPYISCGLTYLLKTRI